MNQTRHTTSSSPLQCKLTAPKTLSQQQDNEGDQVSADEPLTDTPMACFADDCPCTQLACPIRGNCTECVRSHRIHKRHLPECLQEVLRGYITAIAKQVELGVVDERPTAEYWAKRLRSANEANQYAARILEGTRE